MSESHPEPEPEPTFVYAVAKATNEKVMIPRRWLGHPVLGKPFKTVPSERAKHQPIEPDGETATEIQSFQDDLSVEDPHHESPSGGEEE